MLHPLNKRGDGVIRFSSVNQVGSENHNPDYQRHHLIPLQIGSTSELDETLKLLTTNGFDLDDFGRNGILLPCKEAEAFRTGRPLHRGPHPRYNEVVIERLLQITKLSERYDDDDVRLNFLSNRMFLLQRGLRRGMDRGKLVKLRLNSRDPMCSSANFSQLDAHVDELYQSTKPIVFQRLKFTISRGETANAYLAEI